MKEKKPNAQSTHYVNNDKFYRSCLAYKEACNVATVTGQPKPKIPDYIGECLIKIAEKMSYSRNFINYPFREEMIGDAIENCLLYFDNFDPFKYTNPFSYFTQIVYYAFLRRIEREKRHLYVKHKVRQKQIIDNDFAHFSELDEEILLEFREETANMQEFVNNYEERERNRKAKKAKKKREVGVIDTIVEWESKDKEIE